MPTDSFLRWCRKAYRLAEGSQARRPLLQEELRTLLAEEGLEESLTRPFPEDDEFPEDLDEETRQQMTALRSLQKRLGPVDMPDLDNLQRFVGWLLAHYTWRTGLLDDKHQQRRQQRWVLRDRRRQAAEKAYDILVRVRGTLSSALRPEAAEAILGLSERTPRLPGTLRLVLAMAIRRMRNPKPYFDDTRIRGQMQNWDELVAQLSEAWTELDAAERAWDRDHGQAEHELYAKKEAMARYRQVHAASRHFAKGLMFLAGRPEWVEEVKDKRPARGSAASQEDEVSALGPRRVDEGEPSEAAVEARDAAEE